VGKSIERCFERCGILSDFLEGQMHNLKIGRQAPPSKRRRNFYFILLVAISFCLTSSRSEAAVVTGLFNTGVDASGIALAPAGTDGLIDPHYFIASSTIGDVIGSAAVTYAHPSYVPDSTTSRWISNSPNGGPGNGTVTFQTSFTVTGSGPVSISGLWGVDNIGEIFLNGIDTGIGLPFGFPAFQTLHPFTIASGFVTGLNTLSFVVTDTGPPLGLRVEGLTSAVPELSTWAMMLFGFGALALVAFRKAKRANHLVRA
jgi:hypothetical protein